MTPLDPTVRSLDRCECCGGIHAATPAVVFNRPGLGALAYRSGTWHEFRSSLLADLAPSRHPALAGLATRSPDDFAIALLDATAAVADVLTFYGERIANESYLRTATERLSLLELARLIGYELGPGVAAQTLVAFTVDDAPGSPGVATLDTGVKVQSVPGHEEKPQTFETVEAIEARVEWNAMRPRRTAPRPILASATDIWLAGTSTGLRPGDQLLVVGPEREATASDTHWDVRRIVSVVPDFDRGVTQVVVEAGLRSGLGAVPISSAAEIHALRLRASAFGANAADWKVMSKDFKTSYLGGGDPTNVDDWPGFDDLWEPASTVIGRPVIGGGRGTRALAMVRGGVRIAIDWELDLDAVHQSIVPGGWLVMALPESVELYRVGTVREAGRAEFGISARVSRLALGGVNQDTFTDRRRDVAVYAGSELLEQAEAPIDPAVTGAVSRIDLAAPIGDLPAGRRLLFVGTDAATGQAASESATLDHVEGAGGVTTLVLTGALVRSYRLADLAIFGNVALATQGETVSEVLGAGNAGAPFQSFALRQPPLTYVRDSGSATGAASTLAVRVNGLLWQEVDSFYGRGPTERAYVTRRDDAGITTVAFGDGIHGARLPTGQENVTATYRKGVGAPGNVRAGQLTTLLTRPLGLRSAINPEPAVGGDDAEPLERARQNAPVTVMTLDRVVSLDDYADFARAYAGIAKALATWSWDGERRGVFVTVAGPGALPVAPEVVALLAAAIRAAGDPFVPLRVATFRPASFVTSYKLTIDPAFEAAIVRTATVDALRAAFGFDTRAFGQPVAFSDVVATVQAVPGVVAVDVDSLARTDGIGGNGLVAPLPAGLPQATSLAGTQAAELLTLAPDPIAPGLMA